MAENDKVESGIVNKCLACDTKITAKNRKYCRQEYSKQCVICDSVFTYICDHKNKQTCSLSCGRKLAKHNADNKHTIKCTRCNKIFQGGKNAKYCHTMISSECAGCHKEFQRVCGPDKQSYCTTECRNGFMRKNTYKIKNDKECKFCQTIFTPTSSGQIYCANPHMKQCEFCDEEYLVKNNTLKINVSKYCSNICSTFGQYNSNFDKTLLHDYKNINDWAIRFHQEHKRKPKTGDFQNYFNMKAIPSFADKKLFSPKRDSRLELRVISFLEKNYPDMKIVRHERRKIDERWLELDIYLPSMSMGFEVQDFETHCRGISDEMSKFHQPMKDKRYHENKRKGFSTLGIRVVDLWEDTIISRKFEDEIRLVLTKN